MAITESQSDAVEITRIATGAYLDDAATPGAPVLSLGFTPKYVKMINETTLVVQEWFGGMGDADAFQTADTGAGTTDLSKITSGGITVSGRTVTLPAPAQNNQVRWMAVG
jgi:hypothetical protein